MLPMQRLCRRAPRPSVMIRPNLLCRNLASGSSDEQKVIHEKWIDEHNENVVKKVIKDAKWVKEGDQWVEISAKTRAHVRPKNSDDERELLEGEITTRAEKKYLNKYMGAMTISQRIKLWKIFGKLIIRDSFIDGNIRKGLTVMAVYAAACEILHDFHHHIPDQVHHLLGYVGTKHAVAFIALSHIAEHYKEHLEDQEKPKHHREEHKRSTIFKILSEKADPTWAPYIHHHHKSLESVRQDLGSFPEFVTATMSEKDNEATRDHILSKVTTEALCQQDKEKQNM